MGVRMDEAGVGEAAETNSMCQDFALCLPSESTTTATAGMYTTTPSEEGQMMTNSLLTVFEICSAYYIATRYKPEADFVHSSKSSFTQALRKVRRVRRPPNNMLSRN